MSGISFSTLGSLLSLFHLSIGYLILLKQLLCAHPRQVVWDVKEILGTIPALEERINLMKRQDSYK